MRGLVLHQSLRLSTDLPIPSAGPREARVRVIQAGICSTDLQLIKGYMAFQGVLGHEFVGRVDDAPDTSLVGKRVVGEINAACRTCKTCVNGQPTHCPYRTTLGIQGRDGAFADYLTLPVDNLFVVPDSITDDQAVFIEPLAAACEITQLVSIKPTDRLVVIGDGKLGLLCAQILALSGCAVTLVGRHADNYAWLHNMGVTMATNPADIPPGADIIVEATGSPEGLSMAIQLVRPRGTIVLKSTYSWKSFIEHGRIRYSGNFLNRIALWTLRTGHPPIRRWAHPGRPAHSRTLPAHGRHEGHGKSRPAGHTQGHAAYGLSLIHHGKFLFTRWNWLNLQPFSMINSIFAGLA